MDTQLASVGSWELFQVVLEICKSTSLLVFNVHCSKYAPECNLKKNVKSSDYVVWTLSLTANAFHLRH